MKRILDLLTKNKVGLSIVVLVTTGFITMASINGCTLTDYVKVNVPMSVQKATNSPPKISLTDAPEVMAVYIRGGEKFKENISRGYEWLGVLASLGTTGIEIGKSMIPGGAIGLSLLSLMGGIFIKGPGTAKEKNKSYNKGMKEGQRLANLVLVAVGQAPVQPPKEG